MERDGASENVQVCLACGREYDSGSGGTYSRAACYCGICLIEAIREGENGLDPDNPV